MHWLGGPRQAFAAVGVENRLSHSVLAVLECLLDVQPPFDQKAVCATSMGVVITWQISACGTLYATQQLPLVSASGDRAIGQRFTTGRMPLSKNPMKASAICAPFKAPSV